jgi:hypothetical protein
VPSKNQLRVDFFNTILDFCKGVCSALRERSPEAIFIFRHVRAWLGMAWLGMAWRDEAGQAIEGGL